MKTILFILLLNLLAANGQESPNITTKTSERMHAGRLLWRAETFSRGSTPILRIQQFFKGDVTNTFRMYLLSGDALMVEIDEDHDGVFETFALHHPASGDTEAFTRQPNGVVNPVSAAWLETYKQEQAVFTEFFDKASSQETPGETLQKQLQKVQKQHRDSKTKKKTQ